MEVIDIDPEIIRFTHSRVRPHFSGCGKKIEDSITELKIGTTKLDDIPLITVIENSGHYFSLNNRRLYMFKYLNREGLLPGGIIKAYRKQALTREVRKYTIENCSLSAVIIKEYREVDCSIQEDGVRKEINCETVTNKSRLSTPSSYDTKTMHATVSQSLKSLKKQAEKGKLKVVNSQLDEWLLNGLIVEGIELDYIKRELNIS
eukprot:gene22380-30631_t